LNEQPQPYGEIKYAAETKIGLMTQCVARDNARKKNFMTLINIAIKVPYPMTPIRTTQILI
jgi:hypothetical protein